MALRLVGAHHVGNALSAAAVALECGATPDGVAAALSAAGPASRWRMEVVDRADGVTVVNDAYNANPESMRAALQALAALGSGPSGPRSAQHAAHLGRARAAWPSWATPSAAAHAEVAATAAELGVDHLVTVGPTEYGARARRRGRRRGARPAARRAGARRRRAGQGVARRRSGPARRRAGAGAGARRVRGVFIAAGVALAVSILLTPYLIRFFARQGFGQEIRDEGPQSHKAKRGTPTMGGVAIMIAIWVGYLVSHGLTGEPITASAMLVLFLTTALGVVGFLDDFIKLRRQRNLGLNKTSKLVGQLVTALVFGILAARFVNAEGLSPASTNLSFVRDITVISFGVVGFVVFGYFVIAAWSNAVNLTDGLDGLAAGTAAMVLATYVIIGFWQFRNACAINGVAGCYQVRDPLDVALVAAAAMGGCIGFLWWNAAPARIFMGDTGLAGARRPDRRAVHRHPHRAAARRDRRGVRGGDAVGGAADRRVPDHPAAAVPDGAVPPPLRAGGLGRDDGDHPVLAARRHVRGAGAGAVLQRVADGVVGHRLVKVARLVKARLVKGTAS